MIDLDHNATTALHPEVAESMARVSREAYGNPGSRHALGRRARVVLEDSRESLAHILGAHPEEVLFTSGGTESINLAIRGLSSGPPGVIATTAGEHPATRETINDLLRRGFRQHILPVDETGVMVTTTAENIPWSDTRLVTVILAHNETGVIQTVEPLVGKCREKGVPIHLDAVQAVGKMPVNFATLGVTALSLGAHKFHGPRGIGALLLRRGARLQPQLTGGHQEVERRAGTEPVTLIAGMARALELWHRDQSTRTEKMLAMRDRLEAGLREGCAPVVVHGEQAPRLPNTLSVGFPGVDGEALLVALDLAGVCCSLGSTCASGAAEPAPALLAMGVSPDLAKSSLRFSVGGDNEPEQIEEALKRIQSSLERLRAH